MGCGGHLRCARDMPPFTPATLSDAGKREKRATARRATTLDRPLAWLCASPTSTLGWSHLRSPVKRTLRGEDISSGGLAELDGSLDRS
eukprot:scaffold70274_cov66-Phaeocystis_antarctica.AAC.1